MKKKNVLNLIKYHTEKNERAFRQEAYLIAKDFDMENDFALSQYIMSLLSDVNTFCPQFQQENSQFLKRVDIGNESIPLPVCLKDSVLGIINAIGHNVGVNKFLFEGPPGTGKTETAKQIARILDRELYIVDFDTLIDSKLGQTSKNIAELFNEIKKIQQPQKIIILFDEIDAIAIDRINSNDLREMGRAGPVKTLASMGISGFSKMLKAAVLRAPMKRNVALEDVGKAGLYLASDLSTGTTGEVIYVDCGCHSAYASAEEMDIISNNVEL